MPLLGYGWWSRRSTSRDWLVTFSKLKTTQAALRHIHNERPFVMEVAEALQPDDIMEQEQVAFLTPPGSEADLSSMLEQDAFDRN